MGRESFLATYLSPGRSRIGPPIPANSLIICQFCGTPVYYTIDDLTGWGRTRSWTHAMLGSLGTIRNVIHKPRSGVNCPWCEHHVFGYVELKIHFIPLAGKLSLMMALSSFWRI